MALFGLYTTRKEKARTEEAKRQSELEAMLKKQNELGGVLFMELSDAGRKNTRVNTFPDGRKAENIGKIQVIAIPFNGGKYSIVVGVPDPTCFTGYAGRSGYAILQADVNVKKNELHVLECPYGPDKDYTLDSFNEVTKKLSNYVERFTMFPRDNEKHTLFPNDE